MLCRVKPTITTSSTKNVYGNRKLVKAVYYVPESVFEIPDGLDLEDKSVVSEWYVKYDILHIIYADDKEDEEIEAIEYYCASGDDYDYKRPLETKIVSVDEYGLDCIYEYEDEKYETAFNTAFFNIAINKLKRSKIYNYGLGLKLNMKSAGIT